MMCRTIKRAVCVLLGHRWILDSWIEWTTGDGEIRSRAVTVRQCTRCLCLYQDTSPRGVVFTPEEDGINCKCAVEITHH